MTMATPEKLCVHCGAGTLDSVTEQAREALAGYAGGVIVDRDDAKPAGLVIEWRDHYLDGTLPRHCEAVAVSVLRHIAAILSGTEDTSA